MQARTWSVGRGGNLLRGTLRRLLGDRAPGSMRRVAGRGGNPQRAVDARRQDLEVLAEPAVDGLAGSCDTLPTAAVPDRDQRLIALVCHDLRTPLNAVIGFSDVMRHELFGPLGHERYRAYSDHIRTSGEQLLKATEDLLALTRIASTSMALRDAVSPAAQVVERLRASLASEHWDRVRLATTDDTDGMSLCCDHNLLAQALLNAASQMLALSPQAAVVEVRLRRIESGACFELSCGSDEADSDTVASGGGLEPARDGRPHNHAPLRAKPLGFAAASMTTALIGGTFHIVGLPGSRLRAEIRLPASTIVAPAREQAEAAGGASIAA